MRKCIICIPFILIAGCKNKNSEIVNRKNVTVKENTEVLKKYGEERASEITAMYANQEFEAFVECSNEKDTIIDPKKIVRQIAKWHITGFIDTVVNQEIRTFKGGESDSIRVNRWKVASVNSFCKNITQSFSEYQACIATSSAQPIYEYISNPQSMRQVIGVKTVSIPLSPEFLQLNISGDGRNNGEIISRKNFVCYKDGHRFIVHFPSILAWKISKEGNWIPNILEINNELSNIDIDGHFSLNVGSKETCEKVASKYFLSKVVTPNSKFEDARNMDCQILEYFKTLPTY